MWIVTNGVAMHTIARVLIGLKLFYISFGIEMLNKISSLDAETGFLESACIQT